MKLDLNKSVEEFNLIEQVLSIGMLLGLILAMISLIPIAQAIHLKNWIKNKLT